MKSGKDCKAQNVQWKRVVRQRAKVQKKRRTSKAITKSAAGNQLIDSCGTRATDAKTTKMAVAPATSSQSQTLREGADSPAAWRPSMRASTYSAATP